MWYISMVHVQDNEESQKKGLVVVQSCIGVGIFESQQVDFIKKASPMAQSIPFRPMGYHFCYEDDGLRPLLAAVQMCIGQKLRVRFRAHIGTLLESTCLIGAVTMHILIV
jgi:hypothetical protein